MAVCNVQSKKISCPRCENVTFHNCVYVGGKGGWTKFTYEYKAYCNVYEFEVTELVDGGDVGQSEWIRVCPFCSKPFTSHPKKE
jgi:hypothetical protein